MLGRGAVTVRICPECHRGWAVIPTDPKDEEHCPTCRAEMEPLTTWADGQPRKKEPDAADPR